MTQEGVLSGVLEAATADTGFKIHGNPAELFTALSAAQGQFGAIKKTKENPFFKSKYADLSDVLDATMPALTANGFCLIQPPARASAEGVWTVHTILGHSSGGYLEAVAVVPPEKGDGWQKFGSALTYCRRYQVSAMLGVASEPDDDGNAADADKERPRESQAGPRQNSRPTPPPAPAKPAQLTDQELAKKLAAAVKAQEDKKAEVADQVKVKDSGGPALSAPVESAPPQPPEAPPPPAVVPEAKKSTPPPLPTLISSEQQKEIGEMLRGARLFRQIDPQTGEAFDAKFTRAQADAFFVQVVGKKTTEISSYDDAARVIAALRQLPVPPPVST